MSSHKKAAVAYAVLCVSLIAIGFGPLEGWQRAISNSALVVAAALIVLMPEKARK